MDGETWVEIPAHRILVVERAVLAERFDLINADGDVIVRADEIVTMAVARRRRDHRAFKLAPFRPVECTWSDKIVLVEV